MRFPSLDIPMHFLGGIAIAYFFHHAAIAAPRFGLTRASDTVTHCVLVFALTCSSTVFWEFAEFVSDRFFGTHAQLGLEDSLGDMLMGSLGGSAFLAIYTFCRSRRKRETTALDSSLEETGSAVSPAKPSNPAR